MPELRNLIMGVVDWTQPTPPAASAAMPKPQTVDLVLVAQAAILRAYPKAGSHRIGMLKDAS
jgi:hypothetical protein